MLIDLCYSGPRQHVTSWSALTGSPRTSSAPSARPSTSASSSTCSVPRANCPPHMTGEVFKKLPQKYTHTHTGRLKLNGRTMFFLRVLNMEELPWTEEEEESAEHPYYNNIPGKMPPPGGFIDTRLTNQNAASDGGQVQLGLCRFISGTTTLLCVLL